MRSTYFPGPHENLLPQVSAAAFSDDHGRQQAEALAVLRVDLHGGDLLTGVDLEQGG